MRGPTVDHQSVELYSFQHLYIRYCSLLHAFTSVMANCTVITTSINTSSVSMFNTVQRDFFVGENFTNESFDLVIRGYHIYKDLPWVPVIGETFSCEREPFNIHDPYAVAIKDLEVVVGHVPRFISAAFTMFLRRGGIITCEVTGARKYSSDLPQGGLEVPC